MGNNKHYSTEEKYQILQEHEHRNLTIASIVSKYDIGSTTFDEWRHGVVPGGGFFVIRPASCRLYPQDMSL